MPAKPEMSVVIPVREDPEGIARSLTSVLDQSIPATDYEIIVVDNGSRDATRRVVSHWARSLAPVRLLVEDGQTNSYAARNRGVRAARGEWIVFLDANMTMSFSALRTIQRTVRRHPCDYLGYPVEIRIPPGRVNAFSRYHRRFGFPVRSWMKGRHYSGAGCTAVRKDVLDRLGGFDTRLTSGGDHELGHRVHRAGYRQHFEPEVRVTHPADHTVWAHWARGVRYGRGIEQKHRYHADWYRTSHLLSPWNLLPVGFPSPRPDTEIPANSWERSSEFLIQYVVKLGIWVGRLLERFRRNGGPINRGFEEVTGRKKPSTK